MATQARPNDLIHTYFARVLGIAYQVLGDAALATEATETCFKRLARQRDADAIAVWRMVVRVLDRYLNRRLSVSLLETQASTWQTTLLNGIARLAPDDRVILLLYYHERLDVQQLAAVLDEDAASLRERVTHIRQRFAANVGVDHALC